MYIIITLINPLYISCIAIIVLLLIALATVLFLYNKARKYKQLSKTVLEAKGISTMWVDNNGNITHVVNSKKSHYKFNLANKNNSNIKDILPAEYHDEWMACTNEVLKTQRKQNIFIKYTTAKKQNINIRFELIFFNKRTILVFERDLLKKEIKELEKNRQLKIMQALLDDLPIATTVKDLNNERKYLIWNKGTELLYSATQEELLGNNESVLSRDLRNAFRNTDEETIATGKSSTIQRVELADGKKHTLSMHKTLFRHDKHKWIISSAIDITELEEKRAELELLNKQHQLTLKAIGMISWSWDKISQTVRWNQIEKADKARILLTNTMEEFFESTIVPEHKEKVIKAFEDLKSGTIKVLDIEYQVADLDNNTYWIETFGIIDEYDNDGSAKSIVGASYNIEERVRMQESLIEAKEKAEESNYLKSAFLANMSHEIRTPLNAIVGFSNILAEKYNDDEESKEYIKIIETNNELLLQLINDILDLSKIESGNMDFVYDDVDINRCLKEIASFATMKVNGDIKIISENVLADCHIRTERNRIMQVINNFVSNAIKNTQSGTIQIGYNLPQNGYIRFYVKDSGKGIPADKIEFIFNRFMQIDSFKQGVGLGLTICKSIIERLNGEIGVESTLGKGSEFWFTIPYTPSGKSKTSAAKSHT